MYDFHSFYLFSGLLTYCILYSLLNSEGSPLAFISDSDSDARVYAAIASNIWSTFEKNGKNLMREDNLKFLLVECEVRKFFFILPIIFIIDFQLIKILKKGNVAITTVSNMLLCLVAKPEVELGILKAKVFTFLI